VVLRGKDHVRAVVVVILSQLQLGQFILHKLILAGFAGKTSPWPLNPCTGLNGTTTLQRPASSRPGGPLAKRQPSPETIDAPPSAVGAALNLQELSSLRLFDQAHESVEPGWIHIADRNAIKITRTEVHHVKPRVLCYQITRAACSMFLPDKNRHPMLAKTDG
jgi:hypothetical protein